MDEYLARHEAFVKRALEGEPPGLPIGELKYFHEKQIRYLQHERLVHLLVTMFTITFFLLALGYLLSQPAWPAVALAAVLCLLAAAYVWHYFRLENGVQRCYHLSNRIDGRMGTLNVDYSGPAEQGPGGPVDL